MRILWILLPGVFVGLLIADGVRRVFSEDSDIVPRLVREQPVTMLAGATIIGSIVLWGLWEVLSPFLARLSP